MRDRRRTPQTHGARWLLRVGLAAVVLVGSAPAPAQPEWHWSAPSRIVVVPDVHGAYSELVGLLEATHLVNADLDWSGADATLVSLGDMVDRGGQSRQVLDLLMRLQGRAAAQGGAVHVVLGNHEVMNLTGDLRYVSLADYAAFADEEPRDMRASQYARFLAGPNAPATEDAAQAAFERLYPPGYFGRERAFEPAGRYGAWLLTLPALIVIDDTAFVHGGLPALVAETGAAELNRRIDDDLHRYFALRARLVAAGILAEDDSRRDFELAREAREAMGTSVPTDERERAQVLDEFIAVLAAPELGADGPLWYRGSVYCNPFLEEPVLDATLERLGAMRVVVGHTPADDRRPRELYDGRLIMLDTGMLTSYFAGRPSALVIDGDRTFVQALEPEERIPLARGRLEAYGLTESETLDALVHGTAQITADRGVSDGRQVSIRYRGKTIAARFYAQDRTQAAEHELAVYGLDRLLGLEVVPPTVEREVAGRPGAVQLEYPDGVTESQRVAGKVRLGGWCPIGPQAELMRALDALTANKGRTADDVLYRRESSVLKLVGHGQTFGTERRAPLGNTPLELSPQLRAALASLDANRVRTAIGRWLDARQIDALLDRRDALLRQAARAKQ